MLNVSHEAVHLRGCVVDHCGGSQVNVGGAHIPKLMTPSSGSAQTRHTVLRGHSESSVHPLCTGLSFLKSSSSSHWSMAKQTISEGSEESISTSQHVSRASPQTASLTHGIPVLGAGGAAGDVGELDGLVLGSSQVP